MTEQAKKLMYSPGQVAACTLLCGPMAGAHLLWSNFFALGQPQKAKWVSLAACTIVALLLLFAFTSHTRANLGLLIGVMLALGARWVADNYQLKKEAILDSAEYSLQSNWKAFGISVAWFVVTCVMIIAISFVLVLLGVKIPD